MTEADAALLVAHHHQGGEREAPPAFDGRRDAVDVHQLLDDVAVGAFFLVPVTPVTPVTAAALLLASGHAVRPQKFKPASRAASARALTRP